MRRQRRREERLDEEVSYLFDEVERIERLVREAFTIYERRRSRVRVPSLALRKGLQGRPFSWW
jgi:hypothetical protein